TSEPDHLGWNQLTQRGRSVRCRGWTAVHKIQAEPTGLLGAPFDIGRLPANNCAPTRLMRADWRLAMRPMVTTERTFCTDRRRQIPCPTGRAYSIGPPRRACGPITLSDWACPRPRRKYPPGHFGLDAYLPRRTDLLVWAGPVSGPPGRAHECSAVASPMPYPANARITASAAPGPIG